MEITNKTELLLQLKALELHKMTCLSSRDKAFQQQLLNMISFLRRIYTVHQHGITVLSLPGQEDIMRPFRGLANKNMLVLPIKGERHYLLNVAADEISLLLSYDDDKCIRKYLFDVISSLIKCADDIEIIQSQNNQKLLEMSIN